MARRPNLLLLDEPTNHLDIEMRQALTVALQSFEGGLVVVSHDRHLIKSVADTLWLVADGKLEVFDGDLDDYQQWLKVRAKAERASSDKPKPNKAPRDALRRLRRELEQIERRIANIAAEHAALDTDFADPVKGDRVAGKHERLRLDAQALEARWMEVGIAIEEAEAKDAAAG